MRAKAVCQPQQRPCVSVHSIWQTLLAEGSSADMMNLYMWGPWRGGSRIISGFKVIHALEAGAAHPVMRDRAVCRTCCMQVSGANTCSAPLSTDPLMQLPCFRPSLGARILLSIAACSCPMDWRSISCPNIVPCSCSACRVFALVSKVPQQSTNPPDCNRCQLGRRWWRCRLSMKAPP